MGRIDLDIELTLKNSIQLKFQYDMMLYQKIKMMVFFTNNYIYILFSEADAILPGYKVDKNSYQKSLEETDNIFVNQKSNKYKKERENLKFLTFLFMIFDKKKVHRLNFLAWVNEFQVE